MNNYPNYFLQSTKKKKNPQEQELLYKEKIIARIGCLQQKFLNSLRTFRQFNYSKIVMFTYRKRISFFLKLKEKKTKAKY